MLEAEYTDRHSCHDTVAKVDAQLRSGTVQEVFDDGLHEFLTSFLADVASLGQEIEAGYRFLE